MKPDNTHLASDADALLSLLEIPSCVAILLPSSTNRKGSLRTN